MPSIAPLAEAAGDDHAVEPAQAVRAPAGRARLGLDPVDLDLGPVVEAGVAQRLDHRQVGVGQVHVLADDADAHRPDGGSTRSHQRLPLGTGRCGWSAASMLEDVEQT